MPSTTNFNWTTPADTDLVKDGAAAIRTLGNNIDASLVDLKGGTTGQVLAKATNADLDFTWTNGGDITEVAAGVGISGGGTSGSVTITNSMATAIDAKGDLVAGTGADTFARLAVGANGTVLTANSSTATGLEWAAAPAATKNFTLLNAGGTALTGAATITISGISGRDIIYVYLRDASAASASANITVRINGVTSSSYELMGSRINGESSWASTNVTRTGLTDDKIYVATMSNNAASNAGAYVRIDGCATSGTKVFTYAGGATSGGGSGQANYAGAGYLSTGAVTSVSVFSDNGNFDNGTVFVYAAS